VFTLAFAAGAQTTGGARELILLHTGEPGSLHEISANEFARRVNAQLLAPYRIRVVADAKLGDGPGMIAALANRQADLVLAADAMTSVGDSFAVFELPYLIRNRTQVRAIRSTLLDAHLQPAAEAKGLRILGLWETGFRHFTNNARPISDSRSLQGIKIAVPANDWRERGLRSLRADAVPMAPRAMQDAIKAGIVDGQESTLADIEARGHVSTQRYLSLSDHLYSPAYLIARKTRLDALPPAVHGIVSTEAQAIERWIYDKAIQMESDLLDRLDQRMQISHADTGALRKASRPLYGEFIRTVSGGAKMIELIEAMSEVTSSAEPAEPAEAASWQTNH
jgi:TRAP-type C4-dicarboxylate transport system substrate-binding protein